MREAVSLVLSEDGEPIMRIWVDVNYVVTDDAP